MWLSFLSAANLYPRHTKLVLSTFFKILQNGIKPCANGVDVVATVYSRFTNCMDGLGRKGSSRTLNLLNIQTRYAIGRIDNVLRTRWTYYEPTRGVLGRSAVGHQLRYCIHRPSPFVPRSSRSQYVCTPTWSVLQRLALNANEDWSERASFVYIAVGPERECNHVLNALGTRWERSELPGNELRLT